MEKITEAEDQEIIRLNEEFYNLYEKHEKQLWIDEIISISEVLATIASYTALDNLVSPYLIGLLPNISFHGLWCIILYVVLRHVTINGQKKSQEILNQMYQLMDKIDELENQKMQKLCQELDSMISENPKKLVLSK